MPTRCKTVFCPVKDENFTVHAHCCDDVWVLRLVSSLVDFSWMIYLLHYGHFDRWRVARRRIAVATNFSSLIIVVSLIRGDILRKFNVSNLKVIRCIVGCMGSYQQPMSCIVLVREASSLAKSSKACGWHAHDLMSGNHCVVKVGHSSAVLFYVTSLYTSLASKFPYLRIMS